MVIGWRGVSSNGNRPASRATRHPAVDVMQEEGER